MHINLSFSSWSLWKTCPQKFKYEKIDSLASETTEALTFGQQFHKLLEKPNASVPAPSGWDFERYSPEHLASLFSAYRSHYGPESFTTLAAEKQFEIELNSQVSFNGSIDQIIKDNATNEVMIMEHKTTGNLFGFADKARLSLQTTLYALGAAELGYKISGVIFNGINTSWGRSNKKLMNDPSKLFERHYVSVEEWQCREALEIFKRDAQRIMEDINADKFSKNAPGSCFNFFRTCPFATLCQISPTERLEMIKTLPTAPSRKFKYTKGPK